MIWQGLISLLILGSVSLAMASGPTCKIRFQTLTDYSHSAKSEGNISVNFTYPNEYTDGYADYSYDTPFNIDSHGQFATVKTITYTMPNKNTVVVKKSGITNFSFYLIDSSNQIAELKASITSVGPNIWIAGGIRSFMSKGTLVGTYEQKKFIVDNVFVQDSCLE